MSHPIVETLPVVPETEADVDVPAAIRRHLGAGLQAYFPLVAGETLPERLAHLAERLDAAVEASGRAATDLFRNDLVRAMPGLRTFAFSLTGNADRSDDLVQETVMKAWTSRERFVPGSNLMAWLFTILRNQFYTEIRKRKREVEDGEGIHAGRLTALPEQEGVATLRRLEEQLGRIPEAQRTALLMVGAEGYTYEEAAERLECKVGTVKSRVSRARACMSDLMGMDGTAAAA